jgi:hypothetical protein
MIIYMIIFFQKNENKKEKEKIVNKFEDAK